MNSRSHLMLAVALALPVVQPRAQHPERRDVVRAAVAFVKDSLPQGPMVVDTDILKGAPADANQIATDLGATTGRSVDLMQCSVVGTTQKRRDCTIRGGATILEVGVPRIDNSSAVTKLIWRHQEAPGRVEMSAMTLELVRSANGQWRVSRVLARGAS